SLHVQRTSSFSVLVVPFVRRPRQYKSRLRHVAKNLAFVNTSHSLLHVLYFSCPPSSATARSVASAVAEAAFVDQPHARTCCICDGRFFAWSIRKVRKGSG
ncbi:unnamed protein product, partial [Amoebophrya sp. A120]